MQVNAPNKANILPPKPTQDSLKSDTHSHILQRTTSVIPSRSLLTPVNTRPLYQLLEGYFVTDYIISWFSHEFPLRYIGARTPMDSDHLKSCNNLPDVVQENDENEIKNNRIAGPFTTCPMPNLKVSPIGVVNTKTLGQHRLIHHLKVLQ